MSQNESHTRTLGDAVRVIRLEMGWSQAQLAEKADCSVSAVVDIERRNNGTTDLLERLVSALHARWTGLPRGHALVGRLEAARKEAGVGRAKLASLAGASEGAVIRLERGTARVATLQAVLPFIAPRCTIRGPNIFRTIRSSGDADARYTPPDVLNKLTRVLGPIGLDPCAAPRSFVRAKKTYTEADDGLRQPWSCATWTFANPPFSASAAFVRKGVAEWQAGRAKRIVFLLKSQTHGRLFHDVIHPVADVLLLRDRLGFVRPDGEHLTEARFGIMLVTLGIAKRDVLRMAKAFPCIHLRPSAKPALPGRRAP